MYNILVVDDEALITDSLARMLDSTTLYDLEVQTAYSGAQALEQFEKQSFDILITDIQMPGISGLSLLEKVRQSWPDCQVILLSVYDTFDYARQAIQYHAERYVLKNEGDEALLSAIGDCITNIQNRVNALSSSSNQILHQDPLINFLMHYIQSNLKADLTLQTLSEQVHLNSSYLSRRCKEITGKNVTDIVVEMRMNEAQRLLTTTRYKINRIAQLVGYGSAAHFSRVFKKHFNCTPQEYR